MAVLTPRRRPKDPDGRMPLRAHLAELRTRLFRSGLAIILGAVAGWYAYGPIFRALQEPLARVAAQQHLVDVKITYTDVMQAFNVHVKVAVYLGIILASPIWLYQLWAFVVPGLTKREKRHAMGFAAAGAPLFCAGIWVGWLVVPNAVSFFGSFAQAGTAVLPSAGEYIGFVTRLLMVFGVAFLLPLILVALNLAGVLSALSMAKAWRVAVFLVFLFAAVASPTPDAGSMLALALPMVALYMLAVGIAWMVDRRRAKRDAFAGLSDDQASLLDEFEALVDDDIASSLHPPGGAMGDRVPAPAGDAHDPDGDLEPGANPGSRYDDYT